MTLEFRVNGRIGRPVEEVFDAVVNPKKLSGYFTTIGGASAPLVAGTTVTWFGGMASVIVDEVEENRKIVFRWDAMVDEGEDGYKTRVEMRFKQLDDGGTMVTQHAVFQSVADRDGMKDSGMEQHAPVAMAQLQDVAQRL